VSLPFILDLLELEDEFDIIPETDLFADFEIFPLIDAVAELPEDFDPLDEFDE